MANKADKLRSLIGLCSSEGAWLIDAKGMNRTAYRAIVDTQAIKQNHGPEDSNLGWHEGIGLEWARAFVYASSFHPQNNTLSYFLLLSVCVCSVVEPCPALCSPMDCSPPGSPARGIFQARIPEWGAISSPRGSF